MYYRLRPPAELMWLDLSVDDDVLVEHNLDLDRLADDWKPTDGLAFSDDLLRIAIRHGHRTTTGLAVNALHTTDIGRSAELRSHADKSETLQRNLRDSPSGRMLEQLMPGWSAYGEELDRGVRDSVERSAQEADEDLAETLAAPVNPALVEHWVHLGGGLPRE